MNSSDLQALLILGTVFSTLGLVSVLLYRRESRRYDDILVQRLDVREFLTHWPSRPWLEAWRIGSWLALILGVAALIAGGLMLLWVR
ncbi:MAG: hypothetical protein N3E40_00615 [Dehalococcoidia bacterium]|nr:hypothetical protein [Dehalococcoidia bacterium]